MTDTRLYLITHAHTQQAPSMDARNWVLSPQGREEARLLAEQSWWAQVTTVALSSELKTRLTVEEILTGKPLAVVEDARFDELRRGGWVDDYGSRVQRVFARPAESIDGWEPADAALARFCAGVDQLPATDGAGDIALVAHGLVLSLYRAHLLGAARVQFEDWRALSFAAVAVVDLAAGTLLQDFEPVGHPSPRG